MSLGVESNTSEIIKMCRALNHKNKLRIIDLIFRKGKKSITDVRNELDLSFSTTHKYLNQLEEAGILFSQEIFENNRQKKVYYLNPFVFNLTPEKISEIVKEDVSRNAKTDSNIRFNDIFGR